MKEFKRLMPYRDAFRLMMNDLEEIPDAEELLLNDALGRVLAEDIVSPIDSPPFDRSAVDGYALRAEGTFPAREYSPVELKVLDEIVAGRRAGRGLSPARR